MAEETDLCESAGHSGSTTQLDKKIVAGKIMLHTAGIHISTAACTARLSE